MLMGQGSIGWGLLLEQVYKFQSLGIWCKGHRLEIVHKIFLIDAKYWLKFDFLLIAFELGKFFFVHVVFPVSRVSFEKLWSSFEEFLKPSLTCFELIRTRYSLSFFSNNFLGKHGTTFQLSFQPLTHSFFHHRINRLTAPSLLHFW